jgi:putative salt-induced outer membrane protein YdiY
MNAANTIASPMSAAAAAVALAANLTATVAQTAPLDTPPAWESTATAGLTLTRGNSKTLLATAKVETQRKWEHNELRFGADAAYGENNAIKNNELVRGYGQYNRLFSERLFGYFRAEAVHDGIADVKYRVALSPGLGYYFVKNADTQLSGEVGPGVVFEKQGNTEKTYLSLRVAERFEHKLSATTKLWQSAEWLPQVDDFNNYILNGEIGVSAKISKSFDLTSYIQDTYDNRPAPGRQKNDVKLVTGITYKF